jgi:hypothetical protein
MMKIKLKRLFSSLSVVLVVSPVFGQNEDAFETYQLHGGRKEHKGWEQRVRFHPWTDEFSVTTPEMPRDYAAQDFRFETFVLEDSNLIPFNPPNLEENEFFIGRRAGWEVSEFAGKTFVLDVKTIPGGTIVERIEVEIPFYREDEYWELYGGQEALPDSVPLDDSWIWRLYNAEDDWVYWEHSAYRRDSWWEDEFQIQLLEDANGAYCEVRISDVNMVTYNESYENQFGNLEGGYFYLPERVSHKLTFSSGQQLYEIKMRLDSVLRFPAGYLIQMENGTTVPFHTSYTGGIKGHGFGYGNKEELNAFGTVRLESGDRLKEGVKVVVFQDGMEFEAKFTDVNGEYQFDLPLRHSYLFSFELLGHSNKRIEVDLSRLPIDVKGSRMMDLDISMMPLPTGFDSSIFEEPYGRGEYVAEHNTVIFDADYTANIRERVLAELTRLKEIDGKLYEYQQMPQDVVENIDSLGENDEGKNQFKLDAARIDSSWYQGSLSIRATQRRWQQSNTWHVSFAIDSYKGGNVNYLILSASPEWSSNDWFESVQNAVSPAAALHFTGSTRYRKLRKAMDRAISRLNRTPSIRIAKIE